jgi:hypothetical protein
MIWDLEDAPEIIQTASEAQNFKQQLKIGIITLTAWALPGSQGFNKGLAMGRRFGARGVHCSESA